MKKRKLAALFTALALMVGLLAGCGSSGGQESQNPGGGGDNPGGGDKEGITNIVVEMVNFGYVDPDLQMVEDAMNEITEAKIGVHITLLTVPIGEMATKLGLMVGGNEQIDMVNTGLLTSPAILASQGLLQPMTEYINNSEILKSKAGDLLKAGTINGEIYAYPGTYYSGQGNAFIYDKDMAAEYKINMPERVSSQDELTDIFKQVKDSGMPCYAISLGDGVNAERDFGVLWEGLGDSTYGSYGVIVDPFNGTEIVNWYETPEYEHQIRLHKEWMDAGYAVPDSISNAIANHDGMAQGACFGFVTPYSTGREEGYFTNTTHRNCGAVIIGDAQMNTFGALETSWGIASSSKNPEAVIKFAELIYSDEALGTLYNFGIEGVHYARTEGSRVITYPEGVDSTTIGYGSFIPSLGDMAELPVLAPRTEAFYDMYEEFSIKNAKASKYLGYSFDPTDVSAEVTAVQATIAKYAPSLSVGVANIDDLLPKFRQELKDSGIDTIIEANKTQLAAWLAEQN